MKRIQFILVIILTTLIAQAQPGGAGIKFNDTTHDFGRFKEEAGPQTYKFEFENAGTSDLLISRVQHLNGPSIP